MDENIELIDNTSEIIVPDETEEFISKRLSKMELSMLRKSKGISQKEMSRVSGLSTQCISDIENPNGGNPTLKSLVRYLECLGYEISFKKKDI